MKDLSLVLSLVLLIIKMTCRLCHHEGCFVTPTYNYPNEKKRIFCVTHKLDGMVSLSIKL